MLCTCLILVVILIGFLFGFKVFTHGFHKLKDTFHNCQPGYCIGGGRPFLDPPPFVILVSAARRFFCY
ncbi:hypothetical protein MLD38_002201 [Melastoma candidum]|uniref:Uncharacterized protein n=1 Tax=Melastoma candidum TaxID=119954 RepID=A0ACB9SF26_9MYRT|nr:hypothetical protein MLD38_002201 [Melastoma candidum]